MDAFRIPRARVHNSLAPAVLVAFIVVREITASSDEDSCVSPEPAGGSALIQIQKGHPNVVQLHTGHPNGPRPSLGQSDAGTFKVKQQSENQEDSKYGRYGRVEREPSERFAESGPGTIEQRKHVKGRQRHLTNDGVKPGAENADLSRLASKMGHHGACRRHPCRLTAIHTRRSGLGNEAHLDEAGYQKVAALKDDGEMAEFVARVVDKCDFRLVNMRGLMTLVPWFSGTTAAQSLEALEDALLHAALAEAGEPWLSYRNTAGVSGESADLGVVGFVQVAALKDTAEMSKFARRLCMQMGVRIVDEAGFDAMVKADIGSDGFQSYEKLQAEVRSAANAPHTWAKWGKHPALLASTESVLSPEATAFGRAAARLTSGGFCVRHPCRSLLEAPDRLSASEVVGVGRTAPLDESGYKKVARLKNDKEMKTFILRVIAMYDCKVTSDGGLSGIVPWFSGTSEVQSFEKLEEVLLFAIIADPKNAWITYRNTARISGSNAALNLTGYVQVAALRRTDEMKKFARRMCKELGVKIVNEGGFEGMINYYSGSEKFQSYERLVSEIKSAAKAPHSWAELVK